MNLKEVLQAWLNHQQVVLVRRSNQIREGYSQA
jgi:DNA gyrase/topoisomerase IV subunit A